MRNRQFYMASFNTLSKQLGAHLSQELREKYGVRSARVIKGDTVKVLRGEYKGIDGKITNVSIEKKGISIEGIKKEKLKGGNIDVYIHTSNIVVTDLNTDDRWRKKQSGRQAPPPTPEGESVKGKKMNKSKLQEKTTKEEKEKTGTKKEKSQKKLKGTKIKRQKSTRTKKSNSLNGKKAVE